MLFLDELPEFPRQTLESLRQPMETGRTTVARAAAHITYPARFQLVAAMNPCRCGYLGDASRECGRAPRCGEDYQNRISGPVLDRIDLTVEVQPASAAELARAPPGEPSAAVAARVARARAAQRARYGEDGPASNAEADSRDVEVAPEAHALAEQAMEKLRLSPRGYTRVLRVGAHDRRSRRAPRWCSGRMWPRRWRSGIGCRDGDSDPDRTQANRVAKEISCSGCVGSLDHSQSGPYRAATTRDKASRSDTEFHGVHTEFHGEDSCRRFVPETRTSAKAPCAKRYLPSP